MVESIRAGLVLALKDAVGPATIGARERALWRRTLDRWAGEEVLPAYLDQARRIMRDRPAPVDGVGLDLPPALENLR